MIKDTPIKVIKELSRYLFIFKKFNSFHLYIGVLFLGFLFFLHSLWNGGFTMDGGTGLWMINMHYDIAVGKISLSNIEPNIEKFIKIDIPYYGIINIIPGYCLARLMKAIFRTTDFHDLMQFALHFTTFLFSVATSFMVVKLCKLLKIKDSLSWITGGLLMVYPVWLGHSFMNFKDIPTAFFYSFLTYATCLMAQCSCKGLKEKILFLFSAIGLLGVKLAFGPAILANIGFLIFWIRKEDDLLKILIHLSVLLFFIALGFYIITPASWHEPLTYLKNEIALMSKYDWNSGTLTWGECIKPRSQEWNALKYLAQWYSSQLPLGYMILFFVGTWVSIKQKLFKSPIIILILFQLLLFPFLGVCKNSVFYNGTRHLLFMLPSFVVIAALGLNFLSTVFLQKNLRIFGSVMLLSYVSFLVCDIWAMAPYQYVYYNEIGRLFLNDDNMLSDYWAVSLKQALDQVPKPFKASYVAGRPFCISLLYLKKNNLQALYKRGRDLEKFGQPFYYVFNVRARPNVLPAFLETQCRQESVVERKLLFSPHVLTLSKAFWCKLS